MIEISSPCNLRKKSCPSVLTQLSPLLCSTPAQHVFVNPVLRVRGSEPRNCPDTIKIQISHSARTYSQDPRTFKGNSSLLDPDLASPSQIKASSYIEAAPDCVHGRHERPGLCVGLCSALFAALARTHGLWIRISRSQWSLTIALPTIAIFWTAGPDLFYTLRICAFDQDTAAFEFKQSIMGDHNSWFGWLSVPQRDTPFPSTHIVDIWCGVTTQGWAILVPV